MQKSQSITEMRKKLKELGFFLLDIFYNAAIIIVLVIVIRSFLVSPFRVVGYSMADTLEDKEFILIDKLSYLIGDIKRGDPIVFLPPIMNTDSPKFDEKITIDHEGKGILAIDELETGKTSPTCQNSLFKPFWFCKQHVKVGDRVYYTPENQGANALVGADWAKAKAMIITDEDIQNGSIQWDANVGTTYYVRIYNPVGPEYFVKRVIGIPGDTVKIENGRTFLKKPNESDFLEIEENFLNKENYHNTYMIQHPEENVFVVPEGQYFVMGDNRTHSNDSRSWLEPITQTATPFVPKENISGKVLVVLWPLNDIHFIGSSDF